MSLSIGTDPELFAFKGGRVIPSEQVVPSNAPKEVARDGVQIELHPNPTHCRQILGLHIQQALREARNLALRQGADLSFDEVITLSEEDLKELPEDCRKLGCQPSENIYEPHDVDQALSVLGHSKSTYPVRSAAGHIHIGFLNPLPNTNHHVPAEASITALVGIMDICVGLPSVLLDRDPRAAERRLIYGRAGEYRKQPHGVEYRTLSNFWLRDWLLFHLVFGLAQYSYGLWSKNWTYLPPTQFGQKVKGIINPKVKGYQELFDLFKPEEVSSVINTNDAERARPLVNTLFKFLETTGHVNPLYHRYEQEFFNFVVEEGIDALFPKDRVVERWAAKRTNQNIYINSKGWESTAAEGVSAFKQTLKRAA